MTARAGVVAILVLLAPPAAAEIDLLELQPRKVEDCDLLVREHPDDLMAYACYWAVALKGERAAAVARLEALMADDPANHAAGLYLANIEAAGFQAQRAETLYADALRGFVETEHLEGQVYAAIGQTMLFRSQGRHAESDEALDRAEAAAEASGEEKLLAPVVGQRGWQAALQQVDLGRAWRLFKRLEAMVFRDGSPSHLQSWALSGLGHVCWATGRYREALEYYRRQADLERGQGATSAESGSRYNVALLSATLGEAGAASPEEVRELYAQALEAAVRAGNLGVEVKIRAALSESWLTEYRRGARPHLRSEPPAPDPRALAEALREASTALELSRKTGNLRDTCEALSVLASATRARGPEHGVEALRIADEGLRLARERGSLVREAQALALRAHLSWSAGSRDAAIAEAFSTLDAVEKIRNLQPDDQLRARTFARWSWAYHRTVGMILLSGEEPPPEAINLAFTVSERLRSRVLLDELDAAHASRSRLEDGPLAGKRREVLARITETQKQLAFAELPGAPRGALLVELEELESEEALLRDEMAREDWFFRALRQPGAPSLAQVQQALGPDQALLAFLVSSARSMPYSRSWVFAIARDRATVIAIPDSEELGDAVAAYLGLLERRDGLERPAAARLYRDLLHDALESLPSGVKRLVIIPDHPLTLLPFDALRSSPDGPPLLDRIDLTLAPSAASWLRLKQAQPARPERSALSVVDPPFPGSSAPEGTRAPVTALDATTLRRLPHTRGEALALQRYLGGNGTLLAGEQASEEALKHSAIASYAVLHMATHTLLDDARPERTAIYLAPGAGEDGLVQVREVIGLELDGQVVILSACSSAAGPFVAGEGVLGLARAFFLAGAHAVVGGLWPLRDDEAAELVAETSRHLGKGMSIGAALAEAKRARVRAGMPAAAWAGLVVLGDGDRAPLGTSASSNRWRWWPWGGLALAFLLLVALGAARRRTGLARD